MRVIVVVPRVVIVRDLVVALVVGPSSSPCQLRAHFSSAGVSVLETLGRR